MVIKQNASKEEFLNEIENKSLYCYGAGNIFGDFIRLYHNLEVKAVIDKNLTKEKIEVEGREVRRISVPAFLGECENAVLLITCLDFYEVEEELEQYRELQLVSCYVYCQMQTAIPVNADTASSGKFQITEYIRQRCNAGNKAPADVAAIAANNGYQPINLGRGTVAHGKLQSEAEWKRVCDMIQDQAVVLMQFPLADSSYGVYKLIELKEKKDIRIIGVVHDIEILRRGSSESREKDFELLKQCADVWIVHNTKMMDALVAEGFDRDRMVDLKIFDYLMTATPHVKTDQGIIIAGNLDRNKAGYVYQLNKVEGLSFHLFGGSYSEESTFENVKYFGTFLPDELIDHLQGRYGLVWDGDSLETCGGFLGEYMKINNPHKMSLYLAAGLPVIIWEEAAEAQFVKREQVGITVKSLYELPKILNGICEDDYEKMKKNAEVIGKRLRTGEYLTSAIKQAEDKLWKKTQVK